MTSGSLTTQRLSSLIFNPSRSIPHVHCYATSEAGEHSIRELASTERGNWKIVAVNSLFADGCLKTLLRSIAESFDYKKKVDTIDDLCSSVIRESISKTPRCAIFLFDSHALARLSIGSFNALLGIPRLVSGVRLVTVSSLPWQMTEQTECLGSTVPAQICADQPVDEESLISAICSEMPEHEVPLIRLVVSCVHAHSEDKQLIKRIVEKTAIAIQDSSWDHLDGRDRNDRCSNYVMKLLKNFERETLMLPSAESSEKGQRLRSMALPSNLRILLLAAFFASHNAAASDKRFFAKLHGKEKRNDVRERAAELSNEQNETGPKAVDVQRIVFIRAVLAKRCGDHEKKMIMPRDEVDSNTQLASLVCMALLARTSCAANLDQPKFKCLIPYSTAQSIARSLDIEINDHLDHIMS